MLCKAQFTLLLLVLKTFFLAVSFFCLMFLKIAQPPKALTEPDMFTW